MCLRRLARSKGPVSWLAIFPCSHCYKSFYIVWYGWFLMQRRRPKSSPFRSKVLQILKQEIRLQKFGAAAANQNKRRKAEWKAFRYHRRKVLRFAEDLCNVEWKSKLEGELIQQLLCYWKIIVDVQGDWGKLLADASDFICNCLHRKWIIKLCTVKRKFLSLSGIFISEYMYYKKISA